MINSENRISKRLRQLTPKLLLANIIIFGILLEACGRAYQSFVINKQDSPWKSGFLSHYLEHVNHPRDLDYRSKPQSLPPINWDNDTIFAYSCYANCGLKESGSPIVLIQGDSWGELLERFGAEEIFKPFSDQGVPLFGGGTTSFSPSNFRAQLNFIKHHLKVQPKVVIAFVDQTDIGDEYYRYKESYDYINEEGERLPVVRVFDAFQHFAYFNFNHIPRQSSFLSKPAFVWILENAAARLLKKIDEFSGWKIGVTNTPDWATISKPLYGHDDDAEKHFKQVLEEYIQNAHSLGVEELVIVSHPHLGHIAGKHKIYTLEVGDLINEVIEDYKPYAIKSRVHHLRINSAPLVCDDKSCGGYFVEDDWASHPQPATVTRIAKAISEFVQNKGIHISDNKAP